jgi:hypothetical protein
MVTKNTDIWLEGWERAAELEAALTQIYLSETTNANATVRRMAKIAHDVLEKTMEPKE